MGNSGKEIGTLENPCTGEPGEDRREKYCRCSDCSGVSMCTPSNDFYEHNGKLRCEVCSRIHINTILGWDMFLSQRESLIGGELEMQTPGDYNSVKRGVIGDIIFRDGVLTVKMEWLASLVLGKGWNRVSKPITLVFHHPQPPSRMDEGRSHFQTTGPDILVVMFTKDSGNLISRNGSRFIET